MDLISKLTELLGNNQFAQGGLFLGILTGALYYIKNFFYEIWILIKRRLISEIVLHDDMHTARHAFKTWLNQKGYVKKARSLAITNKTSSRLDSFDDYLPHYIMAPGRHYIWYKLRPICVEITRNPRQTINNDYKSYIDEIKISCLFGSNKFLKQLIQETAELENINNDTLVLEMMDDEGYTIDSRIQKRPIDSVFLDNNIKEDLVEDIQYFIASENKYQKLGIPYHRGYLLYGPAGCGKTSLIWAIASHFNRPIRVMSLRALASNSADNHAIKKDSILVIEDIDHLIDLMKEKKEFNLSKILNVMDGFAAGHGVVIFLTTNNIEKLNEALIREGRIDKRYYLGPPSENTIRQMVARLKPSLAIDIQALLAKPNMAAIQNELLKNI